MTDKPTPTTDLLKRCAEIHEWRNTGVLSGEALRDYAKRKWPDLHDTLQMAEHETVTEALALLAKWGQPAQAAEPVARTFASHAAGEAGYCLFSRPVPSETPLYAAPQPVAREPQCWCLTCRPMRFEDPYSIRMALCPTCGNKRCPKANDHRNTCTGSNEPGQPGSAYVGGIKGGQHGTDN